MGERIDEIILDEEQQWENPKKGQTGSWKRERGRGELLSTSAYGEQMWGNSLTTS